MNSEWVMVIITAVYVIATCFICWANYQSANASRTQLKEMQRQYEESNRPFIELEFNYCRRTWYVARFVNRGNRTAQHVKIHLDQGFVDSLSEETFKQELECIKDKECIIGAGQSYELFIGSNSLRDNSNIQPLIGTIEYVAQGRTYTSDLFIDIKQYMTFFSATSSEEDLLKSANAIGNELKEIRKHIQNR